MVEMMVGLLIPCMPAVAVLYRRIKPQVTLKIGPLASNSQRGDPPDNAWKALVSGEELPYTEISEPGPLSTSQRLACPIQHRHESTDPSDPKTLEIWKTTEFTVRPSSDAESKKLRTTRPDWENDAWIGGIRHSRL